MWPNEPLAFSCHQLVYIVHRKGLVEWCRRRRGRGKRGKKEKTLPLCRMKFSLTEKTKVIVARQTDCGVCAGRIGPGSGSGSGYAIRQVSSEKFSTCANWTHVTKFANKFHKLRNFPRIRNANEMRTIVDKTPPPTSRVRRGRRSGKWKCRWQMKMPMEVETEVAVKVELQLELKAKAAAQAQSWTRSRSRSRRGRLS